MRAVIECPWLMLEKKLVHSRDDTDPVEYGCSAPSLASEFRSDGDVTPTALTDATCDDAAVRPDVWSARTGYSRSPVVHSDLPRWVSSLFQKETIEMSYGNIFLWNLYPIFEYKDPVVLTVVYSAPILSGSVAIVPHIVLNNMLMWFWNKTRQYKLNKQDFSIGRSSNNGHQVGIISERELHLQMQVG